MSMKSPSNDLFDLIRSLTKTEKRYYRLHALRYLPGQNHYTKLFSLIEKQAIYNEKELSQQFSTNKSAAHFAVIKKQLYENILEALHRYDEFSQPEQKVRKGIHYCSLLLKKGLFSQCKKQIIKYKLLAYRLEKFEFVIELIEIEKRMIGKQQFTSVSFRQLEQLQEEQNICLHQLQISGDYWIKSNRIFKMHYEKKIAPGKINTDLDELIAKKQFKHFEEATNFKSKLDFLQINALHAFVSNDVLKAYTLNTKFLSLLDEHEHLKILHTDRYFSVLNNYLIDSLLLKKHSELKKGIEVLRSLPGKPEFRHIHNLEANVFRQSYLLELNYYVSSDNYSEAMEIINPVKQGLKKYGEKIAKPNIVTFRYLLAYILFCNGDYKNCLDETLWILKSKEAEKITDIYRDTRMLQLLCHFELGDYLLVESLITSIQRSFIAEKIKFETYKELLRYIKQSVQKINKPNLNALRGKLTELNENSNEKTVFNNLNYLWWANHLTKQLK